MLIINKKDNGVSINMDQITISSKIKMDESYTVVEKPSKASVEMKAAGKPVPLSKRRRMWTRSR